MKKQCMVRLIAIKLPWLCPRCNWWILTRDECLKHLDWHEEEDELERQRAAAPGERA